MPIREYKCQSCGLVVEEIFKLDTEPGEIECEFCKGRAPKIMSLPADTPYLWGTSRSWYSHQLGMEIKDSKHLDQIVKERNLAILDDYDSHLVDDMMDKEATISRWQDKVSDHAKDLQKTGLDKMTAMDIALTSPEADASNPYLN